MLIDARTLAENNTVKTEVCIVGAGAAGITLAREFIGQPFRVSLLESGGMEPDRKTQSIYEGENIGLPNLPLDESRLRYFGGTTNHWTGSCRPLDEIDFESRDWIPHSGWPFDKTHLDPFYERAQRICQLGPFTYEAEAWGSETTPHFGLGSGRLITKIFQYSPPTYFGKVYLDEIARADNVCTFLRANVLEIETTDTARSVTSLNVATLEGKRFWVEAKLFILAAGGIENVRLLLLSNKVQKTGLGNQNDLVGRFFTEHPYLYSGEFLPSVACIPIGLYSINQAGKPGSVSQVLGVLALSEQVLRSEKLVNCGVFFLPRSSYKTTKAFASKGVVSLIQIINALHRRKMPHNMSKHLRNVFASIDDVVLTLSRKIIESISPVQKIALRAFIEPAPNPDSRLTLSDKCDRFGKNRVRLDWRLSEIDKRSLRRFHEILGEEVDRAGLGQIKVLFDEDDIFWSSSLTGRGHHMGATRMHVDPKEGVVDRNCQVHGISNLFIAGSSVFPTAGYANPTLTIVALALRLAEHVKKLMT